MYDDTLDTSGAIDFITELVLRPFAKGTVLAYELVLKRSDGQRVYDRSLSFVNAVDARDMCLACPAIKLLEAR